MLVSLIEELRPRREDGRPVACDDWSVALGMLPDGPRVASRQALENYLRGDRVPQPRVFRAMLALAGRDPEEPRAWEIYGKGQPDRGARVDATDAA